MILVISTESDYSTTEVLKWLDFFKKPYLRINENDFVQIEQISGEEIILKINEVRVSLNEISSVWYRRGDINIKPILEEKDSTSPFLADYNTRENQKIVEFIHENLREKKSINSFFDNNLNKLQVLRKAKEFGIKVPSYLITQSKENFIDFYKKHNEEVISKSINTVLVVKSKEALYSSFTYKIKPEDLYKLPKYFEPTFLQEYIKKRFEIRTFFLNQCFYSMVIFSQNNQVTSIDYRHYDYEHPNRKTVFKLEKSFENKLGRLLKDLKINCASLDILIDYNGDCFLIDINPIGQFGMTSKPCNLYLEKKIAEYL